MTVSSGADSSRGLAPVATAAFQILAPSPWTGRRWACAASATAATSAAGHGRPLAGMCGFSIATAESGGRCSPASATARSIADGSIRPSGSGTGASWTAEFPAVAACS